ncbi:two-component system, chemotaxis family, response regulator WspR [Azospirillaceae bacterium]
MAIKGIERISSNDSGNLYLTGATGADVMAENRSMILIVDDTPANIEVLSEILGVDYEILFATGGVDGLDLAWSEKPDIILLDIMMPEMDGYEVCARLKADMRTADTPVIFITAMAQEEDEAKGLGVGAIDYITKPISPAIVKARVRNHLELKRYRDFLESLSTLDGLTGIANRRRFNEVLNREWRRVSRAGGALSLILIDVDFFKLYNDHYGHIAGDECLRKVAAALNQARRRSDDLVARYGGEEFACILADVDQEEAWIAAEAFRRAVLDLAIPHERSVTSACVTISLGVAFVEPASTPEAQIADALDNLIKLADFFLYQAKKAGRNQARRA